jgi:hypothetical protein
MVDGRCPKCGKYALEANVLVEPTLFRCFECEACLSEEELFDYIRKEGTIWLGGNDGEK